MQLLVGQALRTGSSELTWKSGGQVGAGAGPGAEGVVAGLVTGEPNQGLRILPPQVSGSLVEGPALRTGRGEACRYWVRLRLHFRNAPGSH